MVSMKRCCTCKQEKPFSDFQACRSNGDGLQKRCRPCQAQASAAWWVSRGHEPAVKAKKAVRRRAYYEAHREEEKAAATAWTYANYERFLTLARERYEADPDKFKARAVAYRAGNPAKINELGARRRARKRAAFVMPVSLAAIYDRDKGRCGICGGFVELARASMDHVIALSRGGTHEPDNVQLSHLRCNLKKGAR